MSDLARIHRFRSMASPVEVHLDDAGVAAQIETLFAEVAEQCTRFEPDSDLMIANRAGDRPVAVRDWCFAALAEAFAGYELTRGLFDPRVLDTLVALGHGPDLLDDHPGVPDTPWQPAFDAATRSVRVGRHPVDLGGIAKGLAVRWAAELARSVSGSFLICAGGDCYAHGAAPDGGPWSIGVEDPFDMSRLRAVLAVSDAACVTSSVRINRWQHDGADAHHLIDPRTGRSGGDGLVAVTVVGADPAMAEVWAKALFLHGANGIHAASARRHDLAVLWFDELGRLAWNRTADPLIAWQCAA